MKSYYIVYMFFTIILLLLLVGYYDLKDDLHNHRDDDTKHCSVVDALEMFKQELKQVIKKEYHD